MNGPGVKPSHTERLRSAEVFYNDSVVQPKRKGDWMLTSTGRAYWPMDPRAEDVNIVDIAHSLAMQCRYGGHCRLFYSVAEHSVHMSRLIGGEPHGDRPNNIEFALIALLHDATEAYVSDVPRPLKPFLTNYEAIERRNWMAICDAFDLPRVGVPEAIADLDRRMCLREMEALMPKTSMPLGIEGPTPEFWPQCWDPKEAKEQFLTRFDYLWRERMTARHPAAYGRV